MKKIAPYRFKSISAFHQFRCLPPPEHPLFSIIDLSQIKQLNAMEPSSIVFDFYSVGFKQEFNGKVKYGQQQYDFDEGVLAFTYPGQVFSIELNEEALKQSGRLLLIHPDFIWNTPLANKITTYDFFHYAINEALFLSAREQSLITGIMSNIESEYHFNIDQHTQEIIITQIETLLAYSERFYQRQFVTRKKINHEILSAMESLLNTFFDDRNASGQGLPSVKFVADRLNVSPGYLSAVLRSLTGMNTQQHIHAKLIEKAKSLLSTTDLNISEIAYTLGFEHIQSFSKLFKSKTKLSPVSFRQSLN